MLQIRCFNEILQRVFRTQHNVSGLSWRGMPSFRTPPISIEAGYTSFVTQVIVRSDVQNKWRSVIHLLYLCLSCLKQFAPRNLRPFRPPSVQLFLVPLLYAVPRVIGLFFHRWISLPEIFRHGMGLAPLQIQILSGNKECFGNLWTLFLTTRSNILTLNNDT